MLAAGGGRIRDAIQIGERALAAGGDEAALNALIGTLHCRSGNLDAGARHLKAAHSVRPDDAVIALNLITALAQLGRNREALDLITDELVKSDVIDLEQPEESEIYDLVASGNMPRKMNEAGKPKLRNPLPPAVADRLLEWIRAGAPRWE